MSKRMYQIMCTLVEVPNFPLHQKNPSELVVFVQAPPKKKACKADKEQRKVQTPEDLISHNHSPNSLLNILIKPWIERKF